MLRRQTDALRQPNQFQEGIFFFLKLAVLPTVFVICLALAYHGQSLSMSVSLFLQFTAFVASFLSYRRAKYGVIVYAVPYVFLSLGVFLLFLAPDVHDPIVVSLIVLAVTAIAHGAVIYDIRKDKKVR